ncbi:uncharacterized protein LOC114452875 [Parambassis ranga]|uniref:Uncharacterized protein LOC114452874 n=1 Tax=Parambassis ranga TaxID=210632 RepID=A0A6P7KFA7_9TELE|nr:uncharacterized protein LOC114452874 [Parambassis ranga]XP_028288199.1 uncharacterized protein LOC114452875 [Parambassis ranga]
MPATKVIKQKPVEPVRTDRTKPWKANGTETELRAPAVRKSRGSSCPRSPQRGRCERQPAGPQGSCSASRTTCERRARSTSTAPRPTDTCAKATCRRATSSVKHVDPVSACPGQREPRGVRAEAKCASQSHKAFTVIPPNPKKRREIQRKAEAELAALEELRLSRAMAYVSINPSSVGGCMSLEEVRSKQQQEMMQAKRKQKQMKKQVMEETSVLTS